MNYQAHRVGGVCAGTITATVAYQEVFGSVATWNIESYVTLGLVLVGAIFGALLPDIDHPSSKIGRRLSIISHAVNGMFGHRGFTHSILAFLLLTYGLFLVSGFVPAGLTGYYLPFALGIIVGYGSHLLLDMITVSGIPLLYPFTRKTWSIAPFKSGRDDLLVSIVLLMATGSFLYFFGVL